MTWNVAAGIIIGGGVLGLIWVGIDLAGYAGQKRDYSMAGIGWLISALSAAVAVWIVFFKAHF